MIQIISKVTKLSSIYNLETHVLRMFAIYLWCNNSMIPTLQSTAQKSLCAIYNFIFAHPLTDNIIANFPTLKAVKDFESLQKPTKQYLLNEFDYYH